jgi:hypothetical protein
MATCGRGDVTIKYRRTPPDPKAVGRERRVSPNPLSPHGAQIAQCAACRGCAFGFRGRGHREDAPRAGAPSGFHRAKAPTPGKCGAEANARSPHQRRGYEVTRLAK